MHGLVVHLMPLPNVKQSMAKSFKGTSQAIEWSHKTLINLSQDVREHVDARPV